MVDKMVAISADSKVERRVERRDNLSAELMAGMKVFSMVVLMVVLQVENLVVLRVVLSDKKKAFCKVLKLAASLEMSMVAWLADLLAEKSVD